MPAGGGGEEVGGKVGLVLPWATPLTKNHQLPWLSLYVWRKSENSRVPVLVWRVTR